MGVPEAVQWIEKNENATVLCTQIGACSKALLPAAPKAPVLFAARRNKF